MLRRMRREYNVATFELIVNRVYTRWQAGPKRVVPYAFDSFTAAKKRWKQLFRKNVSHNIRCSWRIACNGRAE